RRPRRRHEGDLPRSGEGPARGDSGEDREHREGRPGNPAGGGGPPGAPEVYGRDRFVAAIGRAPCLPSAPLKTSWGGRAESSAFVGRRSAPVRRDLACWPPL